MSVVLLADAKAHLNIEAETYDTELQAFLDAAESAVAKRVGALEPGAVTERVRGCSSSLVLGSLPVVSLTSVTPVGGVALNVADLWVGSGGVVEYADSTAGFGSTTYTVVYQAGRSTLPDDLRMAVLELLRHMWATQRGGGSRPGSAPSTELSNTLPGAAFALPFRVEQLLHPHAQPGFA